MLSDLVLTYGRNRWVFEHVIRNSMGNEIWSIYNDKYFEIWTFFTRQINSIYSHLLCPLWFPAFSAVLIALLSLLFLLYNGQNRSAQPWLRLITGITVSLGRLWYEYFENTSGSSSSEESSNEDKPDSWLFSDQSDNRHREFCRMQHYYRPHFTKITKIWQDLRPIRKSSIILRSGKTLLILLHPLLFNLRRKIFFTDCMDEDYWDEDNSHTASSRNLLFPRSPSSLALRLFIVLNLDSFHEIFFRGARIRRRVTFDTHKN